MTKVKICGITNLDDARFAVECGADALGLNFYPKSSRYIDPYVARRVAEKVSPDVSLIGVFVNAEVDHIVEMVEETGLDGVQLHGGESPETVENVINAVPGEVEVIKAFHIRLDFQPDEVVDCGCDTVLLDAFSNDEFGGTGRVFDWEIARAVMQLNKRVFLAGGLSRENVVDAIRAVRPYAVDACSRLESSPGKKDHQKLKMFIDAVKHVL